jgi:hypothetical protein
MNDTTVINTLNDIIPIILLITGTFGHLYNLLIFSKRINPTPFYFLSNSITNLISLYLGMFIRYLQDVDDLNLVNSNLIVCKFRSFVLSLSNWYILLVTIDRYLISSSNHHRRQLSSLKNACRAVGLITIIFSLSDTQNGSYRIFNDIQIFLQFSLLPPILPTFFWNINNT